MDERVQLRDAKATLGSGGVVRMVPFLSLDTGSGLAVGASVSLTLEPFADHDELVSELLRDTLPERDDPTLYVEAE
jgi:hypothetical protein